MGVAFYRLTELVYIVLWPLMHYLMWNDNVDELGFWKDYVKVNEIFANEVIKNYEQGDISKSFFFNAFLFRCLFI
jgi:trehalose 6-phosphate synthase/phosphatase